MNGVRVDDCTVYFSLISCNTKLRWIFRPVILPQRNLDVQNEFVYSGGEGCNYQGKNIAVGGRILDPSGCGSCTCHEDGLIYCTQMLDCVSIVLNRSQLKNNYIITNQPFPVN